MTKRSRAEHVDAVVIGAGPSGGIVAQELAASGCSVVCLEQGDWVDRARFAGGRPEGELLATQRWHMDPNVRLLEADYPLEVSESSIAPAMYNGVGGSTILYAGVWHRLKPADFRVRTLDGV